MKNFFSANKWAITISVIVVVIVGVLISTTFAFFSASHNSSTESNIGIANVTLDKIATTTLVDIKDQIPLEVTITNSGTISVVVRITPIIQTSDSSPYIAHYHSIDDFVYDGNSTFYYSKILPPQESVTFSYVFDIDTNYIDNDNNGVFIDYNVECVQVVANAYLDAFDDCPQEWLDQLS